MEETLTAVDRWWPSPFGDEDQIGALNHITDSKRLAALASVRLGRVYDLGHVLDDSVPVFPGRYFRQTLVTTAHHANAADMPEAPTGIGDNKVNWVTEIVSGTMPQIVTTGWLVDVPAARGVERLAGGDVIIVDDVERALGRVEPEPGDAVL